MDIHSLQAKDVMRQDVIKVHADMKLRDLARLLQEKHISGVPVVDHRNKLVGVVSQTDIIRFYATYPGARKEDHPYFKSGDEARGSEESAVLKEAVDDFGEKKVQEIMTESPFAADENTRVTEIARMMTELHMHRVIIVDEDLSLAGVITTMDMVKVLADLAD